LLSFAFLLIFLLTNNKTNIPYWHNLNSLKTDSLKKKHVIHKKILKHRRLNISGFNPNSPDYDCVFTNKYTVKQRLKHYPFSRAAKIVVVSFRAMDRRRDILINDSVKIFDDGIRTKLPDSLLNKNTSGIKYESELHIENNQLNYSSLIEIMQLNRKQISKLTNILYNTRVRKPSDYADPGYKCYFPRNAFIFYDRNGKVFEYLEVCFECKHYQSLSNRVSVGTNCNQKYDLLKSFLIDVGIKYGTIQTGQ